MLRAISYDTCTHAVASILFLGACAAECSHLHVVSHAGVVLHPSHQEGHAVHHARPGKRVQPVVRDEPALQDAVHRPGQRLPSQQPLQVILGKPMLPSIRVHGFGMWFQQGPALMLTCRSCII